MKKPEKQPAGRRQLGLAAATFFAATVGVAAISKMELLRSICLLISRGALISMLVILVVLPAALMLCDWLIRHTTFKWMIPESANAKKSEKE